MDVPEKILNSSAIASWSGFIYQGKVALYHCIQLLIAGEHKAHHLKVETLDDFVIYDSENKALSLHQVKAKADTNRSGYNQAIVQASEVSASYIDSNTKRWFHVARDLGDFSPYTAANSQHSRVEFYSYRNGRQYLLLSDVDTELEHAVSDYLTEAELSCSSILIQYKLGLLYTLLDSKVISAHAKIHNGGELKFHAANNTLITLTEILECLTAEVLDENDERIVLNRFRRNLLERTDKLIEANGSTPDLSIADILSCRNAIAQMNRTTLKRLYFSKKPNLDAITLEGFSHDSVESYMEIIALIDKLIVHQDLPHYHQDLPHYHQDLPHYHQAKFGTYLPTAIHLKKTNEKLSLTEIQNNVEALRENATVQDILYEYNNLIVDMKHSPFPLSEASKLTGKFMDISEDNLDKSRLTKIHNVRFISAEDAQEELSD